MNNKIITIVLIKSFLLTLLSCQKNVDCPNAEVCVYNYTQDVVYYRWGYASTAFEDTLMPGESTCNFVGKVKIQNSIFGQSSQTNNAVFYSSKQDIIEKITDCHTNFVLE